MSMNLYVFFSGETPSREKWQEAIIAEGYDLVLSDKVVPAKSTGFFPARVAGVDAGFEFVVLERSRLVEADFSDLNLGDTWTCCGDFRWGGNAREGMGAWMAGAALARLTGGAMYDPEGGEMSTPDSARDVVKGFADWIATGG